jgi:hypothetical protein
MRRWSILTPSPSWSPAPTAGYRTASSSTRRPAASSPSGRPARRQAQAILDRSDLVRGLAADGKVWVVPALYPLDSGRVRFFKPLAVEGSRPSHP